MNDPATRRMRREPPGGNSLTLGGRYIAEHELARGGMGTVYAGRDTVLDRPVAIKILRPEPGREPQHAFLREARAVAALRHPHIADVYDAGIEGETPYIVMEYVPGQTLRDLIAEEAPLDPARAAGLVAMLADALDYAHRRGVVHCDIKPGNVLLPAEDLPKIVDFGIAHVGNPTAAFRDVVVGTAGYISPEQVEGIEPDGRADVYSLAAVLYQMLTGAPPFEGRNLTAVAAQRLAHPPVPPHERNRAVPPELSAIVMRGLERDRGQRYASAAEFAAALRQFAQGFTQDVTRRIPAAQPAAETEWATRRIAAGPERRARWVPDEAALPARRTGPRAPWGLLALLGVLLAVAVAAAVLMTAGITGGGGGTLVDVPNVVNLRIDDAAGRVQDAGLNVAKPVQFVSSAQQPFGTVIRQEPPPGTRLKRESDVHLTVSVGP